MLRWSWRPAYFVLLVIVLASCSGAGGCSGCAGCGITPLPAGFPQASVIDNAASVRVTRPGLDFVAANLGTVASSALGTSGGVIHFNIPDSTTSFNVIFTINVEICKPPLNPGQCVADINIGGAKLNVDSIAPADGPNGEPALQITGTIPVKADDIPVTTSVGSMEIGLGQGGCNGGTPQVTYADVPVTVQLPLVAETLDPRNGYTKIDTDNAVINANISQNDVQICGGILASVVNLFKSFVVGQITGPLQSTLKKQLQSQLCTKPDPMVTPSCPTGSQPSSDGSTCVFTADTSKCVPTLLGMDGHMDLGTALAKFSPGTSGGIDLVLAGGGAADPSPDCHAGQMISGGKCATDPNPPYTGHTPNGLTLGMLGGVLPNPKTTCVPIADNPLPTGIPIPDELETDSIQPWPMGDPGPDINFALSGPFLNFAATSAYNSGVLCLGVSTDQFQALSTGLVSAVVPSLRDLTFEPGNKSRPEAMAVTTRPQKPPVITIGDGTDVNKDPLLRIKLPDFAIDFYVWSSDRFVRVFTFTADLTIPVDLQTGKDPKTNPNGGILPVLGDLTAANGTVTNSDLVWEQPGQLGSALSSLLGGIVGQFLGKGFSPINLSSALAKYGINIDIPAGGFRKLTKMANGTTYDYVGLFADLTTTTGAAMREIDTQARILDQEVHPEAMGLQNADRSRFPKLHVALSSPQDDGTQPVEYSWWIDDQPRAAWTQSRDVTVDPQYLFLQGKHTLYATSRVVGHPESEDSTPAAVPFLIDVIAPYAWLDRNDDGTLTAGAYDFVSDVSALKARFRLTDARGVGAWSDWQPFPSLTPFQSGSSVELQVMDEAGNVVDTNGLIRGRPDPTLAAAGSACGCSTPGASTGRTGLLASMGILLGLAALGLRRRRAAALLVGSLGVVAATTQGCACGGNSNNASKGTGCGDDCNQPCGTPNALGLIGSYTSVAVAGDGTIWVAGYNDADVTNGLLYGDLVVGKYDSGKQQVQWQTVDGLPPARTDGTCPPNDPSTWRHGETDPGPDVGLWTSIQLDANGNPMVSYYDATNAALKFASSPDGGNTWSSHTVMQAAKSDIGRYSKLLLVNGTPTIGFLVVEPGMNGWARSRVVLATASNANPQSASDWTFQDTVVDEQTPCRAEFCDDGQVCVQTTMQCQPTVTGCTPADCGASTAGIGSTPQSCVTIMGKATCENVMDDTYIDTYPDAAGDYVTMAQGPSGIGIVVYDRTRGNLVGVSSSNQAGQWTAQILDGQTGSNTDPMRVDTGDVGIGASLAITSEGDWHVSYVNGWTESLEYLDVPGGNLTKPLSPEVVDNGTTQDGQPSGMPYPDGQHIIGDDSSVTVDADGAIRIVYQDATNGTLREATGTPGTGNSHTWTAKVLAQQGRFAGFFPHYVPQAQAIANWFRATDHTQSPPLVTGDVAFVAP